MSFPVLSWKRIIINEIETPYIISINGIVMNNITGEFIRYYLDKDNYPIVKLKVDGRDMHCKVHRLVCNAFNDNPFNFPEVDHINRNHWDNSKDNLEFVSGHENLQRLYKLREIERDQLSNYKKVRNERTKYTESQILQVCIRLAKGEGITKISNKTNVDISTITQIYNGGIWKHISCYFSFDNDSFFGKDEIKIIRKRISEGFTNKAILSDFDIPEEYHSYFEDALNRLRKIFN